MQTFITLTQIITFVFLWLRVWWKENDVPDFDDEIKSVTSQKSDASIKRYNKYLISSKKGKNIWKKIQNNFLEQIKSRNKSNTSQSNFVSNDEFKSQTEKKVLWLCE